MKKTLLLGLTITLLPTLGSATTLQQAVSTAVKSNPRVLAAVKGRHANDYAVEKARAGYLPTVDIGAGYGFERSRNSATDFDWKHLRRSELNGEIKQNIFQGFFTMNEMERTRANVNSAAYGVQGTANDVALDAVAAYLNIRREQALLKISETNVKTHERILSMLEERTKAGLAREGDLAQTKGRLALTESNVVAVRSEIRAATANYTAVVGKLPTNLMVAPEVRLKDFPKTEQDAITFSLESNPILKQATANVEGRQAQRSASKSLYSPRLDAVASASRNHNIDGQEGRNWDDVLMLRVSWNIFNGLGDVALNNENSEKLMQAQEVRDDTARQTIEQVKLAWASYESAKERLPFLKMHFDQARKTVASYADQYKLGKRSLLDLLDSENELFQTSREYTATKYQLLFAEYRILHTMYVLLPYLRVPMPTASIPLDELTTVVDKHNKGGDVMYHGTGFIDVEKQAAPLHVKGNGELTSNTPRKHWVANNKKIVKSKKATALAKKPSRQHLTKNTKTHTKKHPKMARTNHRQKTLS